VIAPDADIADPLFHVLLFKRDGRLAILRYLAALTVGALHRLPEVSTVTARRVVVAAAASDEDGTALGETDGEIGARLPLVIEIAESPMLLVQPRLARRR
jgi:diacylglycerol kinase family enzyme